MLDVNLFDQLHISLATEDDVRAWSHGEVKKPETINYRTQKPERDGLFCEKIFGPTRDWECSCGKYKRVRYKGIICERCGVEVTRSKVRRERMGHIKLAAPVAHIWYFKGVPSRLGYLLDLAPKDLVKVIYFAAYMVTEVDEEGRKEAMDDLIVRHEREREGIEKRRDERIAKRSERLEQELKEMEAAGKSKAEIDKHQRAVDREISQMRRRATMDLERLEQIWERFRDLKVGDLEGDEVLYRGMKSRYGMFFSGSKGAEAIKDRLANFDLDATAAELKEIIDNGTGQRKTRALKRLKVVNAFRSTGNSPASMVLDYLPVIPPDVRPMVQLDGGRFATSDLNDLYRRVINRNNRLKKLLDLNAPPIMVDNEKRMLQEAVDALFDNGRRGRPVTGPGNRALKSLSDMLKGKSGRFRQNLLGKRVDYSGRSVIVVGPTLKLHQCGLPKTMALELFKPFVMKRLVQLDHAKNVKAAKRMVDRQRDSVWDVLEEVIHDHPVLLNRAPTLHRLGIQAFEPVLVEGKAVKLHPLVCGAFNADFDGDQMAVHLPLSAEAQAEARVLMLSSNNILKPSDGRPVTMPSQDMIIGLYHLTDIIEDAAGAGRSFVSEAEAIMAFDNGELALNAPCSIRFASVVPPRDWQAPEGWTEGDPITLETSLGRTLFNELLPVRFPFENRLVDKKVLGRIINTLAERYSKGEVGASLDALKEAGFYWSTRSGVSIAISDIITPPSKPAILDKYEAEAQKIEEQHEFGEIDDDDRRNALVKVWGKAENEILQAMKDNFPAHNTVLTMVNSGARGNWLQIRQIAGIRGLVANPKGEYIPRPIKSNYYEGLSVLEYFIATHGTRKGVADTALRTADSGYLTRRLVDVSQDVIIRERDCGTRSGLVKRIAERDAAGNLTLADTVETSVYARTLAKDVEDADGNVLAKAGIDLGDAVIEELLNAGVEEVKVRSVLTCESRVGTCAMCYGRSLASGHLVDIGEAVGIIAAQSIGEPGTQLTMRTFHTGGAAAEDITQGLPRVQELFEARTPKGVSPIAQTTGRVRLEETERQTIVWVIPDDGTPEVEHPIKPGATLLVSEGDHVEAGEQLTEGSIDPKEFFRIRNRNATQRLLVDEVQHTYKSQGVEIHDKHIEVIVRQMLRKVTILASGDTNLLPGELVDRSRYEDESRRVVSEGGKPAQARGEIMGITKASLATDSWLSAASFQETTRVLTEAAMNSKRDRLLGLKENVILGKLIPAGTGLNRYHNVSAEPTVEAAEEFRRMEFPEGEGYAFDLDDDYDLMTFDADPFAGPLP